MGPFITFEGIEGCGKTTQIRVLADNLRSKNFDVLATREPGGCPIADLIRTILLDPANTAMTPRTELLLYAAARSQHVAEVIMPAITRGQVVLCDRFSDATLAYQGYGRGLDRKLILALNEIATTGTVPDLTLILDLPVDKGLQRARQRNGSATGSADDRLERESFAFHQRVREGYLALARQNNRCRLIDASGPPAAVADRISQVVDAFLADRNSA